MGGFPQLALSRRPAQFNVNGRWGHGFEPRRVLSLLFCYTIRFPAMTNYKKYLLSCFLQCTYLCQIQGDPFGTGPKKMRISQRLFIRFWTCIYDHIPCFMRSMSILEEMLEMFATTVQAQLNATLHVCESGLQDVLTNRSNFTSNVVFQFLYGAWLVGISFSF